VYPPITIGGRRYIDGGMRSITNADLAAGCDTVLIVAPFPGAPGSPLGPSHEDEVAELRRTAQVHVVLADEVALRAFGTNPLDPATREPSALAGRAQVPAVVEHIRAFWR
jgi:NTE family protein